MSTTITADMFLASVKKWLGPEGKKWRFYKNKADFLTHHRNGAPNNINATPGGFGPLRGGAAHNTASTSQTGMLVYLYNGDSARALPGPLCNWATLKTGEVVLYCWGTSNATGPGDPRADALVRQDKMPLNSELTPTTAGPSDPRAVLYAPYYLGWEACHAAEGATAAQYESIVLMACAYLDVLGGPAKGYSAGSIVMHRELTTTRSDPQGVPKNGQLRRDINARLKAGPPSIAPEPPVTLKNIDVFLSTDRPDGITKGETHTLTARVAPAIAGRFTFQWQSENAAGDPVWISTGFPNNGIVNVTNGVTSLVNRPSKNVNYRVLFAPTDGTYEKDQSANCTVAVVDLVRLMTEHRAMQLQIEQLQSGSGTNTTPGG